VKSALELHLPEQKHMLKHDYIESNGNVFSNLDLPGTEVMFAKGCVRIVL